MGPAAYSADGSVLAVAAGPHITLWQPETNALMATLIAPPYFAAGAITHLEFEHHSPYLIAACGGASPHLCSWNLLTLSLWWAVECSVASIACDPRAPLFVAVIRLDNASVSDDAALRHSDGADATADAAAADTADDAAASAASAAANSTAKSSTAKSSAAITSAASKSSAATNIAAANSAATTSTASKSSAGATAGDEACVPAVAAPGGACAIVEMAGECCEALRTWCTEGVGVSKVLYAPPGSALFSRATAMGHVHGGLEPVLAIADDRRMMFLPTPAIPATPAVHDKGRAKGEKGSGSAAPVPATPVSFVDVGENRITKGGAGTSGSGGYAALYGSLPAQSAAAGAAGAGDYSGVEGGPSEGVGSSATVSALFDAPSHMLPSTSVMCVQLLRMFLNGGAKEDAPV